jgi:hypothetical protein
MADGGYVSVAEKLVAERIRKVARTGDLIRSNLRVTDDRKDAEIDVLLALPGAGFIVVEGLAEIALAQEPANREATKEDVEILGEILRGRALPQADLLGYALERDDLMRALTEQQGVILDVSKLINRLEVRSGAGSGKTWLAIEQARRLTREGQQVALLCYSRGLATYLDRVTRAFGRRGRPA